MHILRVFLLAFVASVALGQTNIQRRPNGELTPASSFVVGDGRSITPSGTGVIQATSAPAGGITGLNIASVAALKALTVASYPNGTQVLLSGYAAAADGGGGVFMYDSSSAAADNGGTVLAPTSGSGRWLRQFNAPINVRWFGARGNGTTDDSIAIAAALSYIGSAGGGRLMFPSPGTYIVSGAGFTLPSNSVIDIAAGATVKVKDGNNSETMIFASGTFAGTQTVTNVTITGGGCIDGNAANQASGKQHGIHLRGSNLSVHGIEIKNIYDPNLSYGDGIVVMSTNSTASRNIRLYDLYIHDIDRNGITIDGGIGWVITDTQIDACGFMGIDIECLNANTPIRNGQITEVAIDNCVSFGLGFIDNFGAGLSRITVSNVSISTVTDNVTPNGDGIIIRGASFISIVDTTINDVVRNGVRIWRDAINTTPTTDITLRGVSINSTGPAKTPLADAHGIFAFGASGFEIHRIVVDQCRVTEGGTVGGEMGIYLSYADNSSIINSVVNASGDAGIFAHLCDGITLRGNTSYGNGKHGTAAGIYALSCTDVRIGGNVAYDDSGGTQNFGINLASCNRVLWDGRNDLRGNASGPFAITDTTNVFGVFYGQVTFPSAGTSMDVASAFVRGSVSKVFLFPITASAGSLQVGTEALVHIPGSDVTKETFRLQTASGGAAPAVADLTFDYMLVTTDDQSDLN